MAQESMKIPESFEDPPKGTGPGPAIRVFGLSARDVRVSTLSFAPPPPPPPNKKIRRRRIIIIQIKMLDLPNIFCNLPDICNQVLMQDWPTLRPDFQVSARIWKLNAY